MNRDQPISDYVRKLIREWEASGRLLQDLARAAHVAKSMPSQVKKGTGVGSRSRAGFARAFGMTDEQLVERAFEWWKEHGRQAAVLSAPAADTYPQRAEAVEVVKDLLVATDAQLRPIIDAYGAELFANRDRDWWISTLMTELKILRRLGEFQAIVAQAGDDQAARDLPIVHLVKHRPRRSKKATYEAQQRSTSIKKQNQERAQREAAAKVATGTRGNVETTPRTNPSTRPPPPRRRKATG